MSLATEDRTRRRTDASDALLQQAGRNDSTAIVLRLDDGLSYLRNTLYTRIHTDVERSFGEDSMLVPLANDRSEQRTKGEIELFMISEVIDEAGEASFLDVPADWLRRWLMELRLGEKQDRPLVAERLEYYQSQEDKRRHLAFSTILERTFPEARRVPLVLYKLFPLAVRVATAVAFGDSLRAGELRNRQLSILPSIADCRSCHGGLVDVDDSCRECGNPLWTIRWMTEMD
jgi:hypothetical protein